MMSGGEAVAGMVVLLLRWLGGSRGHGHNG